MTVLVGLKYKNGIIIGADKQATSSHLKHEESKLTQYKYSKTVLASTGYASDMQLISFLDDVVNFKDILDDVYIDEKYVVKTVCSNIKKVLYDNNRIDTSIIPHKMGNTMLYATNQKLFCINCDFYVQDISFYIAEGSVGELAQGYFEVELNNKKETDLTEEQAIELVKKAINLACKNDIYVGCGIDIITLKIVNKNKGGCQYGL